MYAADSVTRPAIKTATEDGVCRAVFSINPIALDLRSHLYPTPRERLLDAVLTALDALEALWPSGPARRGAAGRSRAHDAAGRIFSKTGDTGDYRPKRILADQLAAARKSYHRRSITIDDAAAALEQLSTLFTAASHFPVSSLKTPARPRPSSSGYPQPPELLRLRYASPFEVVTHLSPVLMAGGGTGFFALLALARRMLGPSTSVREGKEGAMMSIVTFPIRVSERWAYHLSQQAHWENELDKKQLEMLERQSKKIAAASTALRLERLEFLDPEDAQHLLETGESPLDDTTES